MRFFNEIIDFRSTPGRCNLLRRSLDDIRILSRQVVDRMRPVRKVLPASVDVVKPHNRRVLNSV